MGLEPTTSSLGSSSRGLSFHAADVTRGMRSGSDRPSDEIDHHW
jgi:hypothetical protein